MAGRPAPVPRIRFRPYDPGSLAGVSDAPVLAGIYRRAATADGYDPWSTLERLPAEDAIHTTATAVSDQDGSAFTVVEAGGAVVGSVAVQSWAERDGVRLFRHDGQLDPAERRRGIGTAMVAWAEERIDRLAAAQGTTARAVYGANASSTQPDRAELLTDNGYERAFSLVSMELAGLGTLPDAAVDPAHFTVVDAGAVDLDDLWALTQLAYGARQRRFARVDTPELAASFRDSLREPALWTVALAGGVPAGLVASHAVGTRAEVDEVSVHPDHRRRGLAAGLLRHNLSLLRASGVRTVRLHTNGEDVSGARSLNTKFGFQVTKTHSRYRKPARGG